MHLFNDMSLKAEFGGYFHFGDVSIASICLDGVLVDEGTSSMDQLFDKGLVEVSEVDTSGMVGRVIVRNKSQSNLAVFDNDILRGAKQNRVSQATFVLGPGMQSPAPLFCVERSRWRFDGDRNFSSSALAMGPKTRGLKMKMLKESQHRAHVQDSVWNEVDELADKFSSYSRTADLAMKSLSSRSASKRCISSMFSRSAVRLSWICGGCRPSPFHGNLLEQGSLQKTDAEVRSFLVSRRCHGSKGTTNRAGSHAGFSDEQSMGVCFTRWYRNRLSG